MRRPRLVFALLASATLPLSAQSLGYYRQPSLYRDQIVFTAEGDLWTVAVTGGVAQRLTTHPAAEQRPFISPDGRMLAFSASYEGPTEVYTLELGNPGVPVRRTFEGGNALVVGWTPRGEIVYSTRRYSGLPNTQLALVDVRANSTRLVPLAQASDGVMDDAGNLYFTRLPFQGSYAKRYRGGTAQNIWRFASGQNAEATPLTADYPGTSRTPMVWNGRIYFASDRDGTMNLWSMTTAGRDVRQHTRHAGGFDVLSPSLHNGRIAYQLGADIRVYDIAANTDREVPIRLVSDFDQWRERWIRNPVEWITDYHLSPTGDRVAFTVRGQVYVLPAQQGRTVQVFPSKTVRFREAKFFPGGAELLAIGDESGENELWKLPANGAGARTQLTSDATVMRWDGQPSPDGKYVVHWDKHRRLWLVEVATKQQRKIGENGASDYDDVRWSPDSKFIAFATSAPNGFSQIWLHEVATNKSTAVTTDRYDSGDVAWSPDGKWLYFLSNRHLQSLVFSPWGNRQPEPFFDKQTRLYLVSMRPGERSPFQPDDELFTVAQAAAPSTDSTRRAAPAPAAYDLAGLQGRLIEAPIPNGNYAGLEHDGRRLYLSSVETGGNTRTLHSLEITNKQPRLETFMENVRSFELSHDRKKMLVRRANEFYVLDVGARAPTDLARSRVDLSNWQIRFDPRDEWRQMFVDAWRLHRDWFYDTGMHGVDWKAQRARYEPLVARVTDRAELSDLVSQMIGELSTLHASVFGGDLRAGRDTVAVASLGATFEKVQAGFRVAHIYRSDPDIPTELGPLARPGVNVREGDVIVSVNGQPAASESDIGALLRGQADKQVLLGVRGADGAARQVVVVPVSPGRDFDLRYDEWEYTRRLAVDQKSENKIGYVHLRAMGTGNIAEWAREFYPVFDRQGLIIDVRNNSGGNIDSWVLGRLVRKAWMYWQARVGSPYWNMQGAFRGHMVVLANEWSASDGELFAEGFRRLGLGKVIGTRTWGGEVWLTGSNSMVDRGIATAAEFGVYGPEGEWLIEGHGVDPDIVVDNLPHATFRGEDKQLDAAIAHLQEEIRKKPVPVPAPPKYPVKAFTPGVTQAGRP